MAIKKLTNSQATTLLPPFVVGLVYDRVLIDLPVANAGINAGYFLQFKRGRNTIRLHPDDYQFLQSEVVVFFLNRPFLITDKLAAARINSVWPTPDPETAPEPGDPSSLTDSLPLEF